MSKQKEVKNYLTMQDCIEYAHGSDEQKTHDEMVSDLKGSLDYYKDEYAELVQLMEEFDYDVDAFQKASYAISKGITETKATKKYGIKKSDMDLFKKFHKYNTKIGIAEAKLGLLGEL